MAANKHKDNTRRHINTISNSPLEPVNQEVVVSLRQSCYLPQQVSVDHIGAGTGILRVLHTQTQSFGHISNILYGANAFGSSTAFIYDRYTLIVAF